MEHVQISPGELFSIVMLFELGITLIVGLGINSKQGAWTADVLELIAGSAVFLIYAFLYQHFPQDSLTACDQRAQRITTRSNG